jgi:hypothetical protein
LFFALRLFQDSKQRLAASRFSKTQQDRDRYSQEKIKVFHLIAAQLEVIEKSGEVPSPNPAGFRPHARAGAVE